MNILVLGTPDDVRGFALAGVAGVAPANRREVEERLAAAADLELLLVSSEVATLAPRAVAAAMTRAGGPLILVLPQASERSNQASERSNQASERRRPSAQQLGAPEPSAARRLGDTAAEASERSNQGGVHADAGERGGPLRRGA